MLNRRTEIAEIIRKAGKVAREAYRRPLTISHKGGDPRDIVTNADREISEIISKSVASRFPGETIYSEEADVDTSSGSFWSIDPIDGTAKFSRGIPHYAITIAYVEHKEPVAGAVYNPITEDLFSFEKGAGAFYGDAPAHVSNIIDLPHVHVFVREGRDPVSSEWAMSLHRFLLENARNTSNFGSSSLDLCYVGSGKIEACIYGNATPIDMAAAIGFVREAGGLVISRDGNPCEMTKNKQSIIAINSKELLEKLPWSI